MQKLLSEVFSGGIQAILWLNFLLICLKKAEKEDFGPNFRLIYCRKFRAKWLLTFSLNIHIIYEALRHITASVENLISYIQKYKEDSFSG